METLALLEMLSIFLSAIIVGWLVFRMNIMCRRSPSNRSISLSINIALFLTLFDLFVHEIEELYASTIPYLEESTSAVHLIVLLLALNALVLFSRERFGRAESRK